MPKPRKPLPKAKARIKRTSRPKAQRTTARAIAERAADEVWRKAIKARAEGYSEKSGAKATDAHHVIGRTRRLLRWDLDNGIFLTRAEHDTAHAKPKVFKAWFAATFPATWARISAKAIREARVKQ